MRSIGLCALDVQFHWLRLPYRRPAVTRADAAGRRSCSSKCASRLDSALHSASAGMSGFFLCRCLSVSNHSASPLVCGCSATHDSVLVKLSMRERQRGGRCWWRGCPLLLLLRQQQLWEMYWADAARQNTRPHVRACHWPLGELV